MKAATAATLATAVGYRPAREGLAALDEGDIARVFIKPVHRVVDLTHVMTEDFPTYFGGQQLFITEIFNFEDDGFNMNEWELNEHTGTHMDAPIHFSADQDTADMIPIGKLIVPLAVVDIRAKAEINPDAQLTPEDIIDWESMYGRIPRGACVAMLSGWADKLGTPEFRGEDENGVLHFPGFHVETAEMLIEDRHVHGIAVDTLSLDYGPSADFATHYRWLPSNRWGLENVANLDRLPAKRSTIVAGGPKVAGATGGPSRLIALVHGGRHK